MITTNIHRPTFTPVIYDRGNGSSFATIEIRTPDSGGSTYIAVFLDTPAGCDTLIKAVCAAKDMLTAAEQAAALAPVPDRGRYDAPSAAAVAEGTEGGPGPAPVAPDADPARAEGRG